MVSKKKKRRVLKVRNIVIFLGIVLAMVGLFSYAITMPIRNVYIKGNQIVTDDEIMRGASLYDYPSFLLTKKSKIVEELLKNEYIDDVVIHKKLGNIIELEIVEYQVVAKTYGDQVILSNGKKLVNTYELSDIPILVNEINNESVFKSFAEKFGLVDVNILRQISQIEYSPVDVDEERFLLYMNDGNLVYITLTKISKLNKYDRIKDQLNGQMGIIYLDSGDFVELKQGG